MREHGAGRAGPARLARLGPVLATGLLALLLAGCGGSTASDATTVTHSVELRTAYFPTLHATALVDSAGYALYVFAPDDRQAVTCTGTCALTWPPVTVPAGRRAAVGPGVRSGLVGSDPGANGSHVVTYNGWPLYTYTDDVQPGTASGQALDLNGGAWYLIRPSGSPITSARS